jgi:hypothetical protein
MGKSYVLSNKYGQGETRVVGTKRPLPTTRAAH